MDWHNLALTSHYQTALAVQEKLKSGEYQEAQKGMEELIEAMSKSERRILKSQIIRLLAHIIKWKSQPEKQSPSWVYTIESARVEIADILEEEPSLTLI